MIRLRAPLRGAARLLAACALLSAVILAGTGLRRAEAAGAPSAAVRVGGGAVPPGYQLEGFRWSRSSIPVYYNWEGGTCAFAGGNFTGPPTSIPSTVLTDTLSAAITDLNQKLRGGLVLEFAGPATHTELCSTQTAKPIVVGFGAIATTGQALSFGNVAGGAYTNYTAARVFISNTTNFACSGQPQYRDLQLTMTHELLHSIGIGHSQERTAIMAPTFTACQAARSLQADDLAAIAVLYPPTLPAVTATPPAVATPGAAPSLLPTGSFATSVMFAPSGQALTVFNGGTPTQLEAAAGTNGATGAWVQDGSGIFRLLVVNGPTFLRDQFRAAFPQGIPANTAVALVR